jgi:ABC-type glutathione transport system ATPase component
MLEFKRNGVAIVLVSHNLSAVRQVCDRVGVLDKGEMRLITTPAEAINSYASSATGQHATEHEENAVVLDGRGRQITRIRAGEPVEIVARMTPGPVNTSLCSILCLRRIESDQIVYVTTSPSLATPSVLPAPGEVVEARWRLNMNLARGHYRAEVMLMETVRKPPTVTAVTPLLIVEEDETEQGTVFLGAGCSLLIDSRQRATVSAIR